MANTGRPPTPCQIQLMVCLLAQQTKNIWKQLYQIKWSCLLGLLCLRRFCWTLIFCELVILPYCGFTFLWGSHTHTNTHIHKHTQKHTHTHTHKHTHTYTHTHTHTHTQVTFASACHFKEHHFKTEIEPSPKMCRKIFLSQ